MLEFILFYQHLKNDHIKNDEALKSFEQIEEAIRSAIRSGDRQAEAAGLIEYGRLMAVYHLGDPKEYYQKAYSIANETGDKFIELSLLRVMGQNYLEISKFPNAESCFHEALLIAKELNNEEAEKQIFQQVSNLEYIHQFDEIARGNK
jgi:hypothetical protein